MSISSIMLRAAFKRSDDKRDKGLTTPEDVLRFDNIQYGANPKWNVLDVYRPKNTEGPLPVIVSVHGGGWVYGDKERYQYYCMSLAEQGFAVVNYSYRLAPKYKFPSSIEDTNSVFRWVLFNAEQYGFDSARIFAVGDSAGAHNLALYSCICTNEEFTKEFSFTVPKGFAPTAIALNCGSYRIDVSKKTLTSRLMADYLPEKGSSEEIRKISVIDHLTSAFPPSFIMTAEGDFLAPEAMPMVNALKELNVPVEYHYYGDANNVLGHVFHCNIRLPDAQQCNRDECEWFKSVYADTQQKSDSLCREEIYT